MILYNVTIKVERQIHEDWLKWMQDVHIPDVLATHLFTEHKLCRLLSVDDEDGITYAVQYFCTDMERFQEYQEKHARQLQEAHSSRYKGKYVAFRTLMEVL